MYSKQFHKIIQKAFIFENNHSNSLMVLWKQGHTLLTRSQQIADEKNKE
jgi:hypothetical protein